MRVAVLIREIWVCYIQERVWMCYIFPLKHHFYLHRLKCLDRIWLNGKGQEEKGPQQRLLTDCQQDGLSKGEVLKLGEALWKQNICWDNAEGELREVAGVCRARQSSEGMKDTEERV